MRREILCPSKPHWLDLRIDSVLSTRSQLDYHRGLITMVRAAILISLVFAGHVLHAALPAYSTSPSRQFVIYGADATLRGAISELAEQTKTNLLGLLRQRDGWKTAIVINLQSQQANLPEIPPANLRV